MIGIDEDAVVLELGSVYSRVGYSSESLPRHVLRSPASFAGSELSYTDVRDFLKLIYFQ
jgi:actin-related protein